MSSRALTKEEHERFACLRAVIQFGETETLRKAASKQYAELLESILRRQKAVEAIKVAAGVKASTG